MKKSLMVWLVNSILVVGIIVLSGTIFLRGHWSSGASRKELLSLYEKAQVGGNAESVKELFVAGHYSHLTLDEPRSNVWTICTPYEFGAKNWVLWIECVDSRIADVKIRLLDDKNTKPSDAPPDKNLVPAH
jgi:hypothetical protein